MKLYTKYEQIIIASSSETRIKYLKQFFNRVLAVSHKVEEKKLKEKHTKLKFIDLVKLLAQKKAESIMLDYPKNIIIGSDQILVCEGKLINKAASLLEAKKNMIKMRGKKHKLISSTYAIKNRKFYFKETKEAELLFKNISSKRIEEYLQENKDVLTSVGSYRIEDNGKYNFLKVLKGDYETIIGFPLKKFKHKFMEDIK